MEWLLYLSLLIALGFLVGTGVLWLCALTTDSQHATLRTAVIYNAVMSVIDTLLFIVSFACMSTDSSVLSIVLIIGYALALIVAFVLLTRLYDISFLTTLWIFIAMWIVQAGVEKLLDLLLG